MSIFSCSGRNVPIGSHSVSGNLCPENGVWLAVNDNKQTIVLRGKKMPLANGKEVVWELTSYFV